MINLLQFYIQIYKKNYLFFNFSLSSTYWLNEKSAEADLQTFNLGRVGSRFLKEMKTEKWVIPYCSILHDKYNVGILIKGGLIVSKYWFYFNVSFRKIYFEAYSNGLLITKS